MYLVIIEDDEGMWWDDPVGFHTEEDARKYIDDPDSPPLPDGYSYTLYRCYEVPLNKTAA